MKVISVNLAQAKTLKWRGKEIQTGIYKYPVEGPITLKKEDVSQDTVVDRVHHGGEYKACYLFGAEYYSYWKKKYPKQAWDWGMFGENLTLKGLDEQSIQVGNVYQVGSAVVQITEPRQPCYKLGLKFNDQKIIKQFIQHGHPGTYVRVVKEGEVNQGDIFELILESNNSITVQEYHIILNGKPTDQSLVQRAVTNEYISAEKREKLKKLL